MPARSRHGVSCGFKGGSTSYVCHCIVVFNIVLYRVLTSHLQIGYLTTICIREVVVRKPAWLCWCVWLRAIYLCESLPWSVHQNKPGWFSIAKYIQFPSACLMTTIRAVTINRLNTISLYQVCLWKLIGCTTAVMSIKYLSLRRFSTTGSC